MTLETYLKQNNVSIGDFSEIIGVTSVSLYRYLDGKRKPKPAIALKIVKMTGGEVTLDIQPCCVTCLWNRPRAITCRAVAYLC